MRKKNRVIPMFGIPFGITIAMISIIVVIPIITLILNTLSMSGSEFLDVILSKRVLASFGVSLSTAFWASLINTFMGFVIAWVLIRYDFPFKRLMDSIIELPFALPTAVAGMTLTAITSSEGVIGKFFYKFGIDIAYTRLGITVAMIFVGIPFVVRSVQPVLEKLDPTYEEVANIMGASRFTIFFKVIFPEVLPALLTGFGLVFGRCIGEYGSVVFIAGNKPYETEIVPLLIMSKLESFDYDSACAIALVLLFISFLVLFTMNIIRISFAKKVLK